MSSQILVSVDPGLRCSGVAVFKGTELVRAAALKNPSVDRDLKAWLSMAVVVKDWVLRGMDAVDVVVIEGQQIYRASKANPDDILQLTGVSSAIAMGVPAADYRTYLPAKWKGQVPRTVFSNRTWGKLSEAEQAVIEPSTKDELADTMHAVALGWFHLRIKR